MSRGFNDGRYPGKPFIIRKPVEEPTEPQVDTVMGEDEIGPILKPFTYTEMQLHVRKELFEDAQLVMNWGGTLSYDDLLLLKAAARVLLLRGITGGDYLASGPPMRQQPQPVGNPVGN